MKDRQASSPLHLSVTTTLGVGAIALATLAGIYAIVQLPAAYAQSSRPTGEATLSPSSPAQIALAEHLGQIGAKMYGAYWCPHCGNQKKLFGQEAASKLNYIECDPGGENPQPQLCQAAQIRAFPTWEINGQFYEGTQSLEKLVELSGYSGPTNF